MGDIYLSIWSTSNMFTLLKYYAWVLIEADNRKQGSVYFTYKYWWRHWTRLSDDVTKRDCLHFTTYIYSRFIRLFYPMYYWILCVWSFDFIWKILCDQREMGNRYQVRNYGPISATWVAIMILVVNDNEWTLQHTVKCWRSISNFFPVSTRRCFDVERYPKEKSVIKEFLSFPISNFSCFCFCGTERILIYMKELIYFSYFLFYTKRNNMLPINLYPRP